jgi:predicted component of type VI protein secretion system
VTLPATRACGMIRDAMAVAGASVIFSDGLERPLEGDLAIGRGPENDVVLHLKSVSREHARLVRDGDRWYVEDRGSFNGTQLNGQRVPPGTRLPLRHADRIEVGTQVLVFSQPAEAEDPDRTESAQAVQSGRALSPLQLQVVRLLAEPWLEGGTLDRLPSNEEIAAKLGTPGAAGTVKAALRRAYAKAGVSDLPAHAKRRALCRIARERDWI